MTFTIDTAVDADGVAFLHWSGSEDADQLAPQTVRTLVSAWCRVETDPSIVGVVFVGGPRRFFGGLDLAWLDSVTAKGDRAGLEDVVREFADLLRRIEGSTKPTATVLTSETLDAGWEIALACGRRFVGPESAIRLGFTEGRLGLPPMGGGAIRLAAIADEAETGRMIGGAMPIFSRAALKAGLVTAAAVGETIDIAARDWVLREAARRHQKPALRAVELTLASDRTAALNRACTNFVDAAFGNVARGLVRTLGLAVEETNRLRRRPDGIAKRRFSKVGVLGAGLMGGGIALVAARAGMEVLLLDVDHDRAEQGLSKVRKQEQDRAREGRADPRVVEQTLSRISATSDYSDLAEVDIVVEAVFEDRSVKAEATRRAEQYIRPDTLFATNTSTLPIHSLAEASARPENFIGTHFFSPVPHMALLEIIRGRETSDATLAGAMDFAQAIEKTPILVNDSRGFYTTRVVMAYQAEAYDMLAEGLRPDLIEQAGQLAGMPVPPLALSDAVGLDLVHQINRQAAADLGDAYRETPGYVLVMRLVEEHRRTGKKSGGGFFDYGESGKPLGFWSGLSKLTPGAGTREAPVTDLRDRLLAAQVMETVRCFEEGVITDCREADLGAILGWGFAPWTGGPISYIARVGIEVFANRCAALHDRYGSARLQPTNWLREGLATRIG